MILCRLEMDVRQVADLLRGDYKQNDLFTGELSDEDKVVYVGTVIRSKLLE